MPVLDYETRGRWPSSGGSAVVREGEREVATIDLTPGGLFRGPVWTWHGAFGPEWRLTAESGDSRYAVTLVDGTDVGVLDRAFASSRMDMLAQDGSRASVDAKRVFDRERSIDLPGDTDATVTRSTAAFTLSSAEHWQLEIPDDLHDPLRTLVLAVPIVLDHRQRRQESS